MHALPAYQRPLIGLRGRLLASDLSQLASGDAAAIALWRFEAEQAWVDLAALQAVLDYISAERLGGATPLFPDLAAVPDDWLVVTGRLLDLFADRHAPAWLAANPGADEAHRLRDAWPHLRATLLDERERAHADDLLDRLRKSGAYVRF